MKRIAATIVAILCLSFSQVSATESQNWDVAFGIMKKNSSGNYQVVKQTTTLPMKYKYTGFRFGFTVNSPNSDVFKTKLVLHLPEPPEVLGGDMNQNVKQSKEGRVFSYPEKTYHDVWRKWFWFDKGDPTGEYKFDVYINDKLIKTILFTVIPNP